eukprot:PITA_13241
MLMQERPNILFVQETKCNMKFLEKIAIKVWPGGQISTVDARGASGGLAILWDSRIIQLSNIHANKHFIQATFHLLGTNTHGHITNVYFPQESQQKAEVLDHLTALNSNRQYPLWIAGGDFNMITRTEEKQGGRDIGIRDGHLLKNFVRSNWLIDLPSNNGLFTWTNKREGDLQIASRLDRFLISDNAPHLGGDIISSILPISGSDHWPIELQWQRPGNTTKRPFRFEYFWLTHPNFKDFVRQSWLNYQPSGTSKMARFQKKLQLLKKDIKHWNLNTFGNIFAAQAALNQNMKQIQSRIMAEGRTIELTQQEQKIEDQLPNRALQEEILWKHKSRIKWLKEGERNTKFFHNTTIQCRMHNLISHIQNEQGERVESHEGIEENFLNYFKEVHQEPNINRLPAIEKILPHIPRFISPEHNNLLLQPIQLHEVDTAVRNLKAGKAPGPDGFTSDFFHHFWDLIQIEVWQLVEESRALRWMYPGLNATFLALIPKSEEANKPEKYRPIALCNITYKIVSKVIANRLKPLLPLLISPEQSGYVEGRQITDGIILTHEILHSLKQSKKPGMLLKIDLSKAFDSVSWIYIQKILNAFGFDSSWTRWLISLISSSFFSILINGIPYDTFRPSRGIRQGDPLSPFLFVIVAEGLGHSIKSVALSHNLKGLSFNNSPPFTHQQFVDDNMLFGHPSVQEARLLKDLLSTFSDASSALINRVKSQIFFFNTPTATQNSIAHILGFTIAKLPSKYLGAPMIASTLKHASWTDLLDKFEAKLSLWTHRALNMASRIILIKAVLQSLPLYLFALLAAPKWVIKAIKNLQRNFLWGSSGKNRKWALVKWDKVCFPKKSGGIGLRDPALSNTVMSTKLWWRWLAYPNTPWASLWTAKYANNKPLEDRIRMDGQTARFWDDSWQQLPKLRDLIQNLSPTHPRPHNSVTVHSYWNPSANLKSRHWQKADQILGEAANEGLIQALDTELQKRQININDGPDLLRWGYEEKGTFSTREAYNITIQDKIWNQIWDSHLWPKVSTFLWLLSHNKILTWDNLRKRSFSGPSICLNCRQEEETAIHLLFHCSLAKQLWDKATFICQKDHRVQGDLKVTLRNWPQTPYQSKLLNSLWQLLPGFLLWNIWKERNRRIFKDQHQSVDHLWHILFKFLKDSLSVHSWIAEDLPSTPTEKSIWDNWQITLSHQIASKSNNSNQQEKDKCWTPPPPNLFQLNFDGASKGNPGPSGFGGVFRDHTGTLHLLYLGSNGWDTNNSSELEGLWQGLLQAQKHNLFPLKIEGDSQIIINMSKKLSQGTLVHKVS